MYQNVVVWSIDSLRHDGSDLLQRKLYSRDVRQSLNTKPLDKFCRQGTIYLNAFSTNTYTTAAHASLFTGLYPPQHRIRNFFDFRQKLSAQTETLAEVLGENGFGTYFYTDIKELFSEMDIWRGFRYKTHSNMNWLWNVLEENTHERRFVFLHTFGVHEPYLFIEDQSEEQKINQDYFDAVTDIRRYLTLRSAINQKEKPHDAWEEIRQKINQEGLDHRPILEPWYFRSIEKFANLRFPKIIDQLKYLGFKRENTLFILLSDHGEGRTEIGQSKNFGHSGELTDEVVRIFLATNGSPEFNSQLFSIAFLKKLIIEQTLGKYQGQSADYLKVPRLLARDEKFVYAESFFSFSKAKAQGMVDDKTRIARMTNRWGEAKHVLYNRSLLNSRVKYLLRSSPEKVSTLINKPQTTKNRVSLGFQYILGRVPDPVAKRSFSRALNTTALSPEKFVQTLLDSPEKKSKPFFQVLRGDRPTLNKLAIYQALLLLPVIKQIFSLVERTSIWRLIPLLRLLVR